MGAENTTRQVPEFGRALRARRRASGFSQARLAEAVGVPTSAIGAWERSERLPDLDRLRLLGRALAMGASELDEWVAMVRAASAPGTPPDSEGVVVHVTHFDLPADPFAADGNGRANGDPADSAAPNRNGREPTASNGNGSAPPGPATWGRLPSPVSSRSGSNGVGSKSGSAPSPSRAASGGDRTPARGRPARQVARPRKVRVETSPPVASVFPTPGPSMAADPEWWMYSTAAPEPWDTATRVYYFGRRLRTAVVLVSLALLLVWAFAELGEGLKAILDLMRGDPASPPTTGFFTG